ncbi:MAG: VOC family protein [Anaerolineae bacterium]
MSDSKPERPGIDPATIIGPVTLGVADLDNMLHFYRQLIGLSILDRTAHTADLGVNGTPLVRMEVRPQGRRYPRAAGLFHLALRLPSRQDLGHWFKYLADSQYPLGGVGDHLVSEALYLADPEGNGIEMYRDRPRDTWEYEEGRIKMDTLPVDLRSLQAEAPATPFSGLPAGTRMGHIHLQVDDVDRAVGFYRDGLGFDLMASWSGAGFLSAGGYHHHIGVNMWNSRGNLCPPPGSLGLVSYEIVLPNRETRDALLTRLDDMLYPVEHLDTGPLIRDPAGNGIVLGIA